MDSDAHPRPFELYAIRYAHHGHRSAADNYLGGGDFHEADYFARASLSIDMVP